MVTNCSLSKPQLCNPRIQYFLMNKLLNSLKLSQYCSEVDREWSIKQFLERASVPPTPSIYGRFSVIICNLPLKLEGGFFIDLSEKVGDGMMGRAIH